MTEQFPANEIVNNENGLVQPTTGKALVLTDEATNKTNMESLNQQVNSMMELSENADPYEKRRRAKICKVCGKEGNYKNIMEHIEANRIAGISILCDLCGQVSKTRSGLMKHKSRHRRNQQASNMGTCQT